jgi:lipoprotein-releasing system permease protein
LNFVFFTAKRIGPTSKKKDKMSNTALHIAGSAVSLGLAVMIIAVAVVTGYKKEIYRKIMGFESHITVTNRSMNMTYEAKAFNKSFADSIDRSKYPHIKNIQAFATKPAIISQNDEIEGVILKGIGPDYDTDFIREQLEEGELLNVKTDKRSNQTVISRQLANRLQVTVGDKMNFFFIQDPPRVRSFEISGIFNTGVQAIDAAFAICDIRHIQRLNGWEENMAGGIEIQATDHTVIDALTEQLREEFSGFITEDGNMLEINSFKDNNPMIVQWLALTDINVEIILVLMIVVAVFNMISGLLIIILERTSMIGILKALGAANRQIKKIFIINGAQLILRGMLWGNIIGIGLLLIQKYGEIIPLDPAIYYVDTVPVQLNVLHILLLNAGTAAVTIVSLFLPTLIISKISPSKTIKFN